VKKERTMGKGREWKRKEEEGREGRERGRGVSCFWQANFRCPALDLRLTGVHLCG